MEDYQIYRKMYLGLFNAVTDALTQLDFESEAAKKLIEAQQNCEQLYIEYDPEGFRGDFP